MPASWDRVTLGRTGLSCSPLGIGSSFGLEQADIEHAFDRGINYFYFGSMRRAGFAAGLRSVALAHRDEMVVAVQSYARLGSAVRFSVERALRKLRMDHADILILGWWNEHPTSRVLDAALALRDAGKVRHLMISGHHRPSFPAMAADPNVGAIMVRYNAAHRGAETEVFPQLEASGERHERPGIVGYTALRWGTLLDDVLMPDGEPTPRASDCYRFVLSEPAVDLSLIGPANRAELDEGMAALDRGPLDPDEMAWMCRVGDAVHGITTRQQVGSSLRRRWRKACGPKAA